ncbi:MAG TPA: ABC transporter permease [Bryobacteraceae bacterium]|jgi:putative ABC transport system permease protein|nr:ABC transporter permease [Bryobacteraceae bacterium]
MRRPEFDDEIESHIGLLAERFAAQGMTRAEALAAARRQFGNLTALQEARNDMRKSRWLETLWQDLRYGGRVLRKNKGFAAVAILTLAMGIGANTAIFSIVNAAIWRPMPYPDPGQLMVLWGNVKRVRVERRGASYPDYRDWRDQSQSFATMAAFDDAQFALTGIDNPERIPGEHVSQPYFALLGIQLALGRTFTAEEDRLPQRDAVVVLSDGLWRRRFGADPGIVGRSIQLDGRAYRVVGVAPAGFHGISDAAELWVPYAMSGSAEDLNERGSRGFLVLARLRRGVPRARAQAEMDAISQRLARAYPATNEARGVEVSPLDEETFGSLRKPLLVLLAAVGFVLLIAATNVANLLLARSDARQHEMAMRAALGGSRGRLMRQLLAEGAVLVACGCAAGLALAYFGIPALMAASPLQLPSFFHPTIDGRVGLFTILVCGVVTLALGLAPAVHVAGAGLEERLKRSVGRSTGSRGGSRLRDALVVVEVSISLLLLIAAGLMIRSLGRLAALDPGYDPTHVIHLRVSLPERQLAGGILSRVAGLPAVESASIASDAPLTGESAVFYTAEGQPPVDAHNRPRAYFHRVSPDFFHTLHTRLLAGRSFSPDEVARKANVAIVTENLVRRFWPGQDPIGKRIKQGPAGSSAQWLTIIGVVVEMRYRGLPRNPTADPDLFQVFNERAQDFSVLVRTSVEPAAMLTTIRTALKQAEPSILIYNAGTLEELIGQETARPRFIGWLMGIFAGIALVLATIGIYGVISYGVQRRTREIGLRMALGADGGQVLRMVVGRGIVLVVLGILAGTAAALVLTRMMATVVYGVSATDPLTFVAAAVVLSAAAVMACIVPAARASRIDPVVALRDE